MPLDSNQYITTATNEYEFGRIISQRTVFAIPYFQREYVWSKANLDDFQADLEEIDNNENNVAFLGAIILYKRPEIQSTQATYYDVIDGQQRMITLCLYIISIAERLVQMRDFDAAAEVLQVIFNTGRSSLPSNIKIYPCGHDRTQFNNIIRKLLENPSLSEAMGFTPVYLNDGGPVTGKLSQQYSRIRKILREYGDKESIDRLVSHLTDKVNFVQLDLNQPNDATKVFERLNFRGVKVTVGDLVRNEIFVDSYSIPQDELNEIYNNHWSPFYERFGSNGKDFESFLFNSSLIHDHTIHKSGIYALLRNKWDDLSLATEKIDFLKTYLEEFSEIKYGNSSKNFSIEIKTVLEKLRTAKVADVVHPFLMKILHENANGNIPDQLIVEIIELIESYVVRRGLCGYEQTGMYKIFVSLWVKTKDDFTIKKIRSVISSYSTQPWPDDVDLKNGINKTKVDKARVLYHVLNELERSQDGDIPQDDFTIEHILPQNPEDNYPQFSSEEHEQYCRTLANLIPASSSLNSSVKNAKYLEKKRRFADDSMFKTPRKLATDYSEWTPDEIKKRSKELYSWVKTRWKY